MPLDARGNLREQCALGKVGLEGYLGYGRLNNPPPKCPPRPNPLGLYATLQRARDFADETKLNSWDGEIILDYLGRPSEAITIPPERGLESLL